jgi:hypothetical protein
LCMSCSDDDFCASGSDADFAAGIALFSEFAGKELIEFCKEDTVSDELFTPQVSDVFLIRRKEIAKQTWVF